MRAALAAVIWLRFRTFRRQVRRPAVLLLLLGGTAVLVAGERWLGVGAVAAARRPHAGAGASVLLAELTLEVVAAGFSGTLLALGRADSYWLATAPFGAGACVAVSRLTTSLVTGLLAAASLTVAQLTQGALHPLGIAELVLWAVGWSAVGHQLSVIAGTFYLRQRWRGAALRLVLALLGGGLAVLVAQPVARPVARLIAHPLRSYDATSFAVCGGLLLASVLLLGPELRRADALVATAVEVTERARDRVPRAGRVRPAPTPDLPRLTGGWALLWPRLVAFRRGWRMIGGINLAAAAGQLALAPVAPRWVFGPLLLALTFLVMTALQGPRLAARQFAAALPAPAWQVLTGLFGGELLFVGGIALLPTLLTLLLGHQSGAQQATLLATVPVLCAAIAGLGVVASLAGPEQWPPGVRRLAFAPALWWVGVDSLPRRLGAPVAAGLLDLVLLAAIGSFLVFARRALPGGEATSFKVLAKVTAG